MSVSPQYSVRASHQFSTRDVHPRDRLAYWQDVACKAFVEIECRTMSGPHFDAAILSDTIGDMGISLVSTDECDVHRHKRSIPHSTSDDVLLSLQTSGTSTLTQYGRYAQLGVGDFAIYDTMQPYTLRVTAGVQQLVLKLPRRELEHRIGPVSRFSARAIRGDAPLSAFASEFLASLPRHVASLDLMPQPAIDDLKRVILDVIALSFRNLDQSGMQQPTSREITLARLKLSIERNLTDPALKPSTAAAAAGISVRYANELLSVEDTSLERYILDLRLSHCAAALRDPRQTSRRIGEIALSHGFADASHFGKRFRERFAQAPRDYRQQPRAAVERDPLVRASASNRSAHRPASDEADAGSS